MVGTKRTKLCLYNLVRFSALKSFILSWLILFPYSSGSVGDGESALSPNVYVSDDGGYSWFLALTGPHHYEILDSGALLLAVEHTNSPVNQIKWGLLIILNPMNFFCLDYLVLPTGLINVFSIFRFSTNEGQCWNIYNFTNDPLYFGAIVSEPGFRSMNVSLWGYRNRKKIVITIDFRMLLTRDCETFVTRDWCFEYWVLSTEL